MRRRVRRAAGKNGPSPHGRLPSYNSSVVSRRLQLPTPVVTVNRNHSATMNCLPVILKFHYFPAGGRRHRLRSSDPRLSHRAGSRGEISGRAGRVKLSEGGERSSGIFRNFLAGGASFFEIGRYRSVFQSVPDLFEHSFEI